MKRVILLFCLLFASVSVFGQTASENSHLLFDPSRDAAKDIKAAVELAKTSGKRILLDVGGNWCIWCRRLDAFIGEHKDIKNLMEEKFITVKVNYSPENKNEEVLSNYPKIAGYPHIFVLEKDGTLLHSQNTGDLEDGESSYSEGKIMEFLHKWEPKKVK